ncbi:MAG: hypothetical protein H0T88_06100 [Lysobacter sp.]|nr:hypothetical protein [Lysobacter sp.]
MLNRTVRECGTSRFCAARVLAMVGSSDFDVGARIADETHPCIPGDHNSPANRLMAGELIAGELDAETGQPQPNSRTTRSKIGGWCGPGVDLDGAFPNYCGLTAASAVIPDRGGPRQSPAERAT